MKKPPKQEPKSVPGWQFVDNFRGNCYACGRYFQPGDVIYWRKDDQRSRVACHGCAKEEASK